MNRRSHDQVEQSRRPGRRGIVGRVLTLGTLAIIALLALSACTADEVKPYTTISPASPLAADINSLYKLVFWLALIVFIGVQFVIVYSALKFRKPKDEGTRPPQIHGNKRIEILWTIIPAIILLVLLVPTISTLFHQDAEAKSGDLTIDVYGKQWWWEIHYGDAQGQNLGVITANEVHLPVNQKAIIRLHSNNVIHSFWVPQLAGKLDVIPGHVNTMAITPKDTGNFYGECAEFCGTQHAWMRFKVVVQSENDFYTWVNDWRTGNPGTTNQDAPAGVAKAPASFAICLACHRVNGMENSNAAVGISAPATAGPNLTNFGCRDTLAAGMLINNKDNVEAWLRDPESVKAGNWMGTVIKKGTLSEQEVEQLATYLESLKPKGGCMSYSGQPVDQPVSYPAASPAASPVASPAATPGS